MGFSGLVGGVKLTGGREHIWRFTKPFKCPTCAEGCVSPILLGGPRVLTHQRFGREKTKAIHCDQRKVKCAPTERNEYTGSAEQNRDRAIERAKNTQEILQIFKQYDYAAKATTNHSTCQ